MGLRARLGWRVCLLEATGEKCWQNAKNMFGIILFQSYFRRVIPVKNAFSLPTKIDQRRGGRGQGSKVVSPSHFSSEECRNEFLKSKDKQTRQTHTRIQRDPGAQTSARAHTNTHTNT